MACGGGSWLIALIRRSVTVLRASETVALCQRLVEARVLPGKPRAGKVDV